MSRTTLASLALALVATLGSTGCGRHRYYVRYAPVPVRVHGALYYAPGAPEPPPAPPPRMAPPPQIAPPPAYAAGPRPIVVYANAPGTTIVVINPGPGGPPVVQYAGGPPPPQAAPMPRPEAPPEAPPQGKPNAWFEEE